MYENKVRLLCTAEVGLVELFEMEHLFIKNQQGFAEIWLMLICYEMKTLFVC